MNRRNCSYLAPILFLIAALLAAPRLARADTSRPEVYDTTGARRDLAYLQERYGNVAFSYVHAPAYQLERIDVTAGPPTLVVRVLDANGSPAENVPVALSWPGIVCDPEDPNIRPFPPEYRTRLAECGITQRTDRDGYTGFGLSESGWYYDANGNAPGIVWVLDTEQASDGAFNLGMKAETNHEGPLSLVFQRITSMRLYLPALLASPDTGTQRPLPVP